MKKNTYILLGTILFGLFSCESSTNKKGYYYDVSTLSSYNYNVVDSKVQIDCEIAKWYDGKNKVISFTWDDCSRGIEEVSRVFDNHNLKTTFFVNTAILDSKKEKVRGLYKGSLNDVLVSVLENGHEVSSHTHNHINLTKLTLAQVEEQFKKSVNSIHDKYGYYPTTLSHPESCYNEQIDSIMSLYFLDSRYSSKKDVDSTIRYMQVRTSYPFDYYKKNIDMFVSCCSDTYVFGGHQLNGSGYEPMDSNTLDSILTYVVGKYEDMCWITTFEDMTVYRTLRDNVSISNAKGEVSVDISKVKELLTRYSHPHAYLTFRFPNTNLDFASDGLVLCRYDGKDSYCTIDLRKSTTFKYRCIDETFVIQKPMRNGK